MQNIGLSWLVVTLTDSPFLLGLVGALQFLPVLCFSLFAGPVVDRFSRRRMIIFTQSMLMVLALLMSLLTATGLMRYWMVALLSLVLGCVNTLDMPARQSFLIDMVGRESLVNAISLNSAAFNAARIVGPAVAGLLIAFIGIAPCFLLNGLSFVGVILALKAMKVTETNLQSAADTEGRNRVLASIHEGLAYVGRQPTMLLPLLLLGLLSILVINYSVFIPLFAKQELAGDALHFGLLMTALGVGSLVAALWLTINSVRGPRLPVIMFGAGGMSLCLALSGLQHDFWLSCLCLALTGFCTISATSSINSWLQIRSEDRMRGRVNSLQSLMFSGMSPVGNLYAGAVAEKWGAGGGMVLSGILGALAVVVVGVAGLLLGRRRYPGAGGIGRGQ